MKLWEHLPTTLEVWKLMREGFSGEQVANLFRMREGYYQGVYHEATPEYRRLAFIRWLYRQGRLQS